jgi:deoxyribose-phosphate aldolase
MMNRHDNLVLLEERRYQLKRHLQKKLALGSRYSESTQAYFENNPSALKRACQIAKQHISYMLCVRPSYVTIREIQSPDAVVVAILVDHPEADGGRLYDVTVDLTRTKVVKVVEIE